MPAVASAEAGSVSACGELACGELVEPVESGAGTVSAGAGGASGSVAGSIAGVGVSIVGVDDSSIGSPELLAEAAGASGAEVSSGGIPRFYSTAGLCFWRLTQRVELIAI